MMKTKYLAGILLLAGSLFTTSCVDDVDYTVATENIISEVTTGDAAVTAVSADISGIVKDLSSVNASSYSVGVIYSTNESLVTTSGSKKAGSIDENGAVTVLLNGLTKNVTYYYATYVTLQGKVTKYGEVKSFTTTDVAIATGDVTNLTAVSATLHATLSHASSVINGAEGEVACGFKVFWNDEKLEEEGVDYPLTSTTQNFSVDLKGLTPGQTYYYVPYFKISDGFQYGEVKEFTAKVQTMEWVDMGTGVLWAKWNLGASKESEVGGMFGWADPTGTITSSYLADYDPAETITGLNLDPAAVAELDNFDLDEKYNSKLPSNSDFTELLNKTTHEWTVVDGVEGYLFKSKVNNNTLFFPAAGFREEGAVKNAQTVGDYWTGDIYPTNTDYGYSFTFNNGSAKNGFAKRSVGMSIRPVKMSNVVRVDNSKIVVGDLENNGRIRVEIFNEFGYNGLTKANPPLDITKINFDKSMAVTFSITGINGNLKDGAPSSYNAGLEYSTPNWWPSYWSSLDGSKPEWDTVVKGDGTYTVKMEAEANCTSAVVFAIDIANLGANLVDLTKVHVTIDKLELDPQ